MAYSDRLPYLADSPNERSLLEFPLPDSFDFLLGGIALEPELPYLLIPEPEESLDEVWGSLLPAMLKGLGLAGGTSLDSPNSPDYKE